MEFFILNVNFNFCVNYSTSYVFYSFLHQRTDLEKLKGTLNFYWNKMLSTKSRILVKNDLPKSVHYLEWKVLVTFLPLHVANLECLTFRIHNQRVEQLQPT